MTESVCGPGEHMVSRHPGVARGSGRYAYCRIRSRRALTGPGPQCACAGQTAIRRRLRRACISRSVSDIPPQMP